MTLAVLASGRGSNFVAIQQAVARGEIPDTRILALISNNPNAAALDHARHTGIPVQIIPDKTTPKPEYEKKLLALLMELNPDYVVLAGYMKLLDRKLVREFENRILNIHPSLLPHFRGLRAQQQALDAGVKQTGCTVHVVTEEMDAGPILGQSQCAIESGDTAETLANRILPLEHALYTKILAQLAEGTLKIPRQPST